MLGMVTPRTLLILGCKGQRSRSRGSTSPHHNKLLNISPQRRGLVQCLCLFQITHNFPQKMIFSLYCGPQAPQQNCQRLCHSTAQLIVMAKNIGTLALFTINSQFFSKNKLKLSKVFVSTILYCTVKITEPLFLIQNLIYPFISENIKKWH